MKNKAPIAIIGLGCKFPGGVSNPSQYWKMIFDKTDAICDVPEDRWNNNMFFDKSSSKIGKTHARQGGYLQEDIYHFDPMFFGLSPRESEAMDPQQRYLLQTTYEALEDAGQALDKIKKTNTGVFIGGFTLDNKLTQFGHLNREMLDSNTATSASMTLLANRLSYVFDLNGPSITVDTACSSSLVATHLACQSIWAGESTLAITGGVNIMSRPEYSIVMSKGKFLSKHSRCMAFDQSAEGYTRGEGCGIAILKPLEQALEDGDYIYSVIRNTGSNQDGSTKGIAMPNGESQKKLIAHVYGEVGLNPDDIHAVEAHGTGTQAGDTTEANAINDTMVQTHRKEKCIVGSVKTNIGHLEAAAGIAGLIKASLMAKKGKILPNIHFNTPNPNIPFDDMQIRIPTEAEPWPSKNKTRRVAVNSFGYGGTNAHAVIESYPQVEKEIENLQKPDKFLIFPISAQDEVALKKLCKAYAEQIAKTQTLSEFYDILHSASTRRTFFKHRACFVGKNKQEIVNNLMATSQSELTDNTIINNSTMEGDNAALVYVFTGMGPQWHDMGKTLYDEYPIFKSFADHADNIFKGISGWSILKEMQKSETDSIMSETHIAQPANFIIQVGIYKIFEQYGIKPDIIVGHSVGEVSSAYTSGVLNLHDALLVSHHRSRLQATLASCGSMLAVGLSEADIIPYLNTVDGVDIAAVNSPNSLTLAGSIEDLDILQSQLNQAGIFNRLLQVNIAYHSKKMDAIRNEVLSALQTIQPKAAHTTLYSTVNGSLSDGLDWNNQYWWNNIRQPVLFYNAVESIASTHSNTIFIEVGPHPVLKNAIAETLKSVGKPPLQAHTLNRKVDEHLSLRTNIAHLFTQGYSLNWEAINGISGQYVKLPAYPWSMQKYQNISNKTKEELFGNDGHIFFNKRIDSPMPMWEVEFSQTLFPYVGDHKVENNVVLPGAAYVEAGLAIARYHLNNSEISLAEMQFHNMLTDQSLAQSFIHTSLDPVSGKFKIHSRIMGQDESWKLHASGKIVENATPQLGKLAIDLNKGKQVDIEQFYQNLGSVGLDYGPAFRPIKTLIRLSSTQIYSQIKRVENRDDYGKYYLIHPTVLDAAFQAMAEGSTQAYVPVEVEKIHLIRALPNVVNSLVTITKRSNDAVYSNITLFDDNKNILAHLSGVKAQKFGQTTHTKESLSALFYELKWIQSKKHIRSPANHSHWLIIGDGPSTQACVKFFQAKGIHYQSATNMNPLDIKALLQSSPDISHIAYLSYLYGDDSFDNTHIIKSLTDTKNLIQTIVHHQPSQKAQLFVLTQNSHRVLASDQPKNLLGATFSAFAQLVENEHDNVEVYCIDTDSDETLKKNMNHIFLSEDPVRERAYRGHRLYRHVLDKSDQAPNSNNKLTRIGTYEKPIALRQEKPSDITSLKLIEIPTQPLLASEIRVKTVATSLNFKDLLKVHNKIDPRITDNTYYGDTLGFEVSGIVVDIGKDVSHFEIGDSVVGLVPDAFKNFVNIPAHFSIKLPKGLSLFEAPSLISYMTAHYSLVTLAQLREGEKVLIHNATGGVGLIALQVALWKNAEIYATAGSDDKRQFLRDIGIQHIYDSRSLKFSEQIRRDTHDYGVDVVLNAIAGEAVTQSLNLLAPYGRFIEIGKKNIADNSDLPMSAFNENILFASVDIDRILKHKPVLATEIINNVQQCFKLGQFKAIPTKVFPISDAVDAFQFMSRSRHMGKIVLSFESQHVDIIPSTKINSKICTDASYLITGGTKGFGLEIAKWIASQNAGQLVLVSRSGASDEQSQRDIENIRKNGTKVDVICADVSSEHEVLSLIESINQNMLPLRGAFHGAVVLEDGFLAQLTDKSLHKVLGPKLIGAVNLHKATEGLPLDIFFCFSSISALIGNKGQASYILANAYLDALCHYRRAKGLAGTSINWGAISEVGILSRKTDVAALFEKFGISSISPEEAFTIIDQALENDVVQMGAFRADWEKWALSITSLASPHTRFTHLLKQDSDDNTIENTRSKFIENCPENTELRDYITQNILNAISQLLKFPVDKLDGNTSINNMGVDSLVAVELTMIFRQKMGFELSTVDILADPTPEQLSTRLVASLGEEETA